jgi:hypothetical protein
MQGTEGSGCLSRENRRPGNARRRDDRRCAVDLDDRHTVPVAHSEDQSKPGILAPAAVWKAHRRAEILPRPIVIPHAAAGRGAKDIPSFCAVGDRQRLQRVPVGPTVLDRLEIGESCPERAVTLR